MNIQWESLQLDIDRLPTGLKNHRKEINKAWKKFTKQALERNE